MTELDDVPSPIDLRLMADARPWADAAMARRPWRRDFFEAFAEAIEAEGLTTPGRVLELGSGPGFLAEHLLRRLPGTHYVALDFSPAMHTLARERLGAAAAGVSFVERSFVEPGWPEGLGLFHHVVTHQAVHELRHKRHAPVLHARVRSVLAPGGSYLVCDHFAGEGGMADDRLYMTVAEQRQALQGAGFTQVDCLKQQGGLVLHRAR